MAGDGKGLQPLAVPRSFVVEMEAAARAAVADLHQAAWVAQPWRFAFKPAAFVVGLGFGAVAGLEGIAAKAIQQIHQQQFLVLLLVLQAQLHQLKPRRRSRLMRILLGQGDPLADGPVHLAAPGQHLGDRWAAQQPPLGPGMALADGVVIAVEQEAPAGIGGLIARDEGRQLRCFEQEFLKEPGGVAQVPFRGAGIGHALEAEVFWVEGGDQLKAAAAHGLEALQQPLAGGGRAHGCGHQPPKSGPTIGSLPTIPPQPIV